MDKKYRIWTDDNNFTCPEEKVKIKLFGFTVKEEWQFIRNDTVLGFEVFVGIDDVMKYFKEKNIPRDQIQEEIVDANDKVVGYIDKKAERSVKLKKLI